MTRWSLLALALLGIAVYVWAQTIHKETVVWDFVNGVKSQGEWLTPGGGGGTGDVGVSGTPTAGQLARWTDATHIEGFTPTFADVAGTASDAQIPDLGTLSTGLMTGRCVETDGNGHLTAAGAACGAGSGSGLPSDPVACPANQFVTDQSASGVLTCAQPVVATLGDAATVVRTSRTLTITGTANQVAVTGGTQDLSAHRTWTIALATNPTLPGTTTGTFSGPLTGNATTATALVANGTNCLPSESPTGVDASGNAEGCHDPLTGIPDPSLILTTTNVKKVSGKQLVPRVNPLVNTAGSVAYDCDTTDVGTLDGITSGITLALPTCTGSNPEPEQEIEYRLQSTLPQTIAYHASFCAMSGFPLPTSTSGDISSVKTYDRLKFRRNAVESCWNLVAVTTGVGRGVTSLSPSTTYTCDWRIAHTCQMSFTAATTTIVVAAPPAVPADGTLTRYKFLCTNLQTLDWTTAGVYVASPNVALPTQCPNNTTRYFIVGIERSSVLGKYQIIATN